MKLLYNSKFLGHSCNAGHPESPERLKFFQSEEETRLINGEQYLELCHSRQYISLVKEYCKKQLWLSQDTFTCADSFETACYAVSAAVQASESNAFALVRPPGHHAGIASGEGFCIFNNIAIAVKRLLQKGQRVFVFDFDLHHGNGTQEILEKEPNAFYFSTHQAGIYPGTGMDSGKNFTNIPLNAGCRDVEYVRLLEKKLSPALKAFKPDVVALSAGFDSYYKDFSAKGFLGSGKESELSKEDFTAKAQASALGFSLTKRSFEKIKELVTPYNHFAVLEGGYNPESIREGVNVFLE
ncbi:MAG TPA: histone deacetylase [Candidatus Diapherotrites archaeon]|uniref:Histone deacetylase n=1 Tax=Candidatus Iainarchaeum sp. TaxID=3101447 RepID=A0A7J4KSG4_9ARCH|nr:histone deacetylase [Candidatus Diapherotrites archaeon]